MNPERAYAARELGQSLWYDNISRALLDSGELARLIDGGIVTGITTNPSIFQKAVVGTESYDPSIAELATAGHTKEAIYHALTMEDVGRAADLLRPVHEQTKGADGYVSLELPPAMAHEVEESVAAGRALADELARPNVMIKVPGTPAGVQAFRQLTEAGYHINVTLLFSLSQYVAVAEAYVAALQTRHSRGEPLDGIASVASFFVSRVDGKVDAALDEVAASAEDPDAVRALMGRAGIANCRVVYDRFLDLFGDGFQPLREAGARVQRVLWASTSTKNPAYPDVLYVDNLLGADTVNTLPPATLDAFLDHGDASKGETIRQGLDEDRALLAALADRGVDLESICTDLLREGVDSFAKAFDGLVASIGEEAQRLSTSG